MGMAFQSLSQAHGLSKCVDGHISTSPKGALGCHTWYLPTSGGVSLSPPQLLGLWWVEAVDVYGPGTTELL